MGSSDEKPPDIDEIKPGDYAEGLVEELAEPSHEVLPRVYNMWTASAYQVLMMASWTCNIVLYSTVTDLGGPMMLIYSTIIVTIGQCLMMSSLAEMCAIWPYAGGQQAFTKKLAPLSVRRFMSYVVGWLVLVGEIATAAGCAMNNSQTIGALIQLSYPDFELTRWQTWLMYVATLAASVFFSLSQKHLPWIAVIGGIITLGGGIAWAATFLALSPKQPVSFVFGEFLNNSGYTSLGWVAIMSFYTPIYALYGTDGILHIVEEMRDAPRAAPRAMVWSMVFSGLTSLLGALTMSFCFGNWEEYMSSDIPFVTWFVDTIGSVAGGAAFLSIVIVLLNFLIVMGINTAASRLLWSMARDNALPFSDSFAAINQRVQTPVNAILFIFVAEAIIGVVVFGSDYAFEAIISLGGAAMQISYLVPVLMLLWNGRRTLPLPRAFTLGRCGLAINIAAACWSTLIIVMLFFPLYVPVNADNIFNMNWAVVMVGGVLLLVSADWILRARFHYAIAKESK